MKLKFLKKSFFIISILIFGILISLVVFLPIILVEEKPYFITIKSNEDLESWSNSGDGTIENPFIIEGHHITVPSNDPDVDEYNIPCFPEKSVISIKNITKSFIIQNNHIVVKGGCGGQYIIKISDISVPFAIRNNYFRSDGYSASSFRLINVDGHNSFISNNSIYYAHSQINNSQNITFIHNHFTYSYSHYAYQCSNISYIQNYFYLTSLGVRDCSQILIDDNIFENDEYYSGWNRLKIWETGYCTITDNTLIKTGLDLRIFDNYYPTAIISGNLVNGKPYGYFYNQSNVLLNDNTQYGQINLVKCNFTVVIDQIISHTSNSIILRNCTNTIVANSTFSHCDWTGINIKSSTNTSILDCVLEDIHSGVRGENSYGIFIKRNLFRSLLFGICLDSCTLLIEEDNAFEGVEFEIC